MMIRKMIRKMMMMMMMMMMTMHHRRRPTLDHRRTPSSRTRPSPRPRRTRASSSASVAVAVAVAVACAHPFPSPSPCRSLGRRPIGDRPTLSMARRDRSMDGWMHGWIDGFSPVVTRRAWGTHARIPRARERVLFYTGYAVVQYESLSLSIHKPHAHPSRTH